MWKHRVWYMVVLISALIAYIVADRQEALVFLCLLVLLPFFSVFLQRMAMRGSKVQCCVQRSCRVGQKIAVRFELDRRSRLPLGTVRIEIQFENILYGEQKECVVLLQPGEQKKMLFTYLLDAVDCGNMKTCVMSIEYQDLTGLFSFRRAAALCQETLIYPPEIRLHTELLQRPETKNFGEMYHQQKKGQDISEVSGLRDYIPGDAMNSIHWKLSGKLDQLIVREFGHPSNYNTLILYEMVRKGGGVEIPNSCNNAVAALTAALSLSLLQLNLEHNVGRIVKQDFQIVPVHSMDTYDQMEMNLLCRPIVGEADGGDMIYSFFRGNLRNEYTKIIYVTPCYEEHVARQLAREMDLTVLQIVQGKRTNYMSSAGYTVISVDVDTYQENVNSISI